MPTVMLRPHACVCAIVCIASALLAQGCGSNGGSDVVDDGDDFLPPLAVTDLAAGDATTHSVTLTWTAPQNDATHNPVDGYDVRYSTTAIDEPGWAAATPCTDEPGPAPGGWPQIMVVDGLASGTTYHFALKCEDINSRYSALSNVASATVVEDAAVTFADAQLEAALCEALGKPAGSILRSDCLSLRNLSAAGRGIVDLSGLQECRLLEDVNLADNSLTHLDALAGLTKLRNVQASHNQIEDLGPLAGLTRIDHLAVAFNRVVELAPLTPLANLVFLDLQENRIVEIGALVANAGLGAGDHVVLYGNPLSTQAAEVEVQALFARGVDVQWAADSVPPATIADLRVEDVGETAVELAWSAPGDDGMSGSAYAYDLRYATDLAVLAAWTGAIPVDGEPIPLPATVPQSMTVSGLTAGTAYWLGIKSRDEAGNWSALSNVVQATPFVDVAVTFPDANLEAALREALGQPTGDLHKSELLTLVDLQASQRGISNLTGLEQCENVHTLNLRDNAIADIGTLAALTRLQVLLLGANDIVDVGPLAGLTSVFYLDLTANGIQSAAPLSALVQLQSLFLGANQIADLTPLSGLVALRNVYVDANQIVDVAPLRGLPAVERVYLRYNQISDIHPLVENPGLGAGDELGLIGNPLSPLAVDVDIPALQARGVTVTF